MKSYNPNEIQEMSQDICQALELKTIYSGNSVSASLSAMHSYKDIRELMIRSIEILDKRIEWLSEVRPDEAHRKG